jgi:hypothetical protein
MIEVKHDLDDEQFPVKIYLNGYKKPFKFTIAASKELERKLEKINQKYTG